MTSVFVMEVFQCQRGSENNHVGNEVQHCHERKSSNFNDLCSRISLVELVLEFVMRGSTDIIHLINQYYYY